MDDNFLEYIFPGKSKSMMNFRSQINEINNQHRLYRNVPTILLLGEIGTGKTFTANAIAAHSAWLRLGGEERSFYVDGITGTFKIYPMKLLKVLTGPNFDEVYLPILTDDIAASELFGHVKGAFTGAGRDNPGRLGNDELADILLDEVGDSTPRIQSKLLQVVESRMYTPVGGTIKDTKETQARLIFASHRNLVNLVHNGSFREDLFWRLKGIVIQIPPLRECLDAIPDILQALLLSCKKEQGKENADIVARKKDLEWCQKYSWPGNVRELRWLLWQYVFEEGRRSLKEIWEATREKFQISKDRSEDTPESLVRRAVQMVIDETLSGERGSLGTVGNFTRLFHEMVRGAIYNVKSERRLKATELERLFIKEKLKDIHTKIGRFRNSIAPLK